MFLARCDIPYIKVFMNMDVSGLCFGLRTMGARLFFGIGGGGGQGDREREYETL